MKKYTPLPRKNAGIMLVEALVSILVFSIGILALVGMQAVAVKVSSDAKYRSDAALLANQLIGQMWVSDRTQATLQANYSSPSGAGYTAWAWGGTGSAGTQTSPASGTVLSNLPGALAPSVVITPVATTSIPSSLVTITIRWISPNDQQSHNYVANVQIGG
jgi:type IV pilus assembly protein PilV